jgi:hypothetical protein
VRVGAGRRNASAEEERIRHHSEPPPWELVGARDLRAGRESTRRSERVSTRDGGKEQAAPLNTQTSTRDPYDLGMKNEPKSDLTTESVRDLVRRVSSLEEAVRGLYRAIGEYPERESDQESDLSTVRRLVVDEKRRVQLQLVVNRATDTVLSTISGPDLASFGAPFSDDELRRRVDSYRTAVSGLAPILAEGCYWGESWTSGLWQKVIHRVANAVEGGSGIVVWVQLRLLPAMMLLYAGGVGAVAAERYENLLAILLRATVREPSESRPAVMTLVPNKVLGLNAAHKLEGMGRRLTPVSDLMFEAARPWLQEAVPDDESFEIAFDRFEFMLGVVAVDLGKHSGPVGRFGWKRLHYPASDVVVTVRQEIERLGDKWPPLKAGFFEGDLERAKSSIESYERIVTEVGGRWF